MAAVLLLVAAAGCRDELPTVLGPDRFPAGARLTSVVLELSADQFLEEIGQFTGYAAARDATYQLVANNFEGTLQARSLVRLTGFPVAVTVPTGGTAVTDTVFTYTAGQIVVPVDTAATRVTGSVTLRLHEAAQEWDAFSTTWTHAVDTVGVRVPWTQPGGSLGPELARTMWMPGDTAVRDSVRWQVDSLTVARMASEDFRGLIVVAEGAPSRVQLGAFSLRTGARGASRPDTVISQVVTTALRAFVFTPEPPAPIGPWTAGGVRAARTLFRVTLPEHVAACPPGAAPGQACPQVPIRNVTLNDVSLLLRSAPVRDGFRPLAPVEVTLRVIAEPELGRRAPLGPPAFGRQVPGAPGQFASAVVAPSLFLEGSIPADNVVNIPVTDHFRGVLAQDTVAARASTAFALLQEPQGAAFGHVRFAASPRLRIVYTLPQQTSSP